MKDRTLLQRHKSKAPTSFSNGIVLQYIARGERWGNEEGAPLGEEGRTTWRGNPCQVWRVWLPPLRHLYQPATCGKDEVLGVPPLKRLAAPYGNAPPLKGCAPSKENMLNVIPHLSHFYSLTNGSSPFAATLPFWALNHLKHVPTCFPKFSFC
jgi:hypothetical protein